MQIFATLLNGRKLTLEVEGHMKVSQLQALIMEKEGIEAEKIIVGVEKRVEEEMQSGRTLESYNIQKEAEIRVITRGQTRTGDGSGTVQRTSAARKGLDRICGAFGDRWQKLEQERFALAERKAAIVERTPKKSPRKKLRLNVGGTSFTVLRSTLASRPHSRLSALVSGIYDGQILRDKKGHLFLDLNPDCFREIVDWLTASVQGAPTHLVIPEGHEGTMRLMLDFLGLGDDSDEQAEIHAERPEEGTPPAGGRAEPEPELELEPDTDGDGADAWKHAPLDAAIAEMQEAMRAEKAALQAAIDDHEKMVAEFEDMQEWIAYFSKATDAPATSELVDIDLGGLRVTAKRSTLLLCPESAFAQLITAESGQAKADDDSEDSEDSGEEDMGVFIEENTYCVNKIVDQLRLRAMSKPNASPPPPSISKDRQDTFLVVLKKFFSGVEHFIMMENEVEDHFDDVWDSGRTGESHELTNGGRTVRKSGNSPDLSSSFGKLRVESGRHRWHVKVDSEGYVGNTNIMIGVAHSDLPLDWAQRKWRGATDSEYYDKLFFVKSPGNTTSKWGCANFGAGDIITVDVDVDAGTVGFQKNGADIERLAQAGQRDWRREGLVGPVSLWICCDHTHDCASILTSSLECATASAPGQ